MHTMPPKKRLVIGPRTRLSRTLHQLLTNRPTLLPPKRTIHVRVHPVYDERWVQRDGSDIMVRNVQSTTSINMEFRLRNMADLEQRIRDALPEGDNQVDDYHSQEIVSWHTEILPDVQPRGNLRNVRMRESWPYQGSFLKYFSGIDTLSHQVTHAEGECVLDALAMRWNCKRNYLIKQFTKASNELYRKPFNPADGVDANMLERVCWWLNASCLGFDQHTNVFVKHVQITGRKRTPEEINQGKGASKTRKSIVFYCYLAHMYIITDDKLILTITQSFKDCRRTDMKVVSEIAEIPKTFHKGKNLKQALELAPNSVALFDIPSVNDLLIQYINETRITPRVRMRGLRSVASFTTKDNVTIAVSETHVPGDWSWKDTQDVCKKADIQFTNQSSGTLLMELFDKFYNKHSRQKFTPAERDAIVERQGRKCNGTCGDTLGKSFHIDHINPLHAGGSNSSDNLQALCQSCHIEKTTAEVSSVKSVNCQSSLNIELQKLMNSKFFRKSHFSQTFVETDEDELLFGADMNKCRRNIMMFYGECFCEFTVLDNVEPFDGEITPGFYYIESDNTFPLTGNGFYSKPMVDYVLGQLIITRSQIKKQVKPSATHPPNHFYPFIQYLLELYGDDIHGKLAVNSFIGCLGRRTHEFFKTVFCHEDNVDEQALVKQQLKEPHTIDLNVDVKLLSSMETIHKLETFFPIHAQILDCEAIELHKAFTHVQMMGGQPVAISRKVATAAATTPMRAWR